MTETPDFEIKPAAETPKEVEEATAPKTPKPARIAKKEAIPAEVEFKSLDSAPVPAAPAISKEEVETDVRKKLAKKTDGPMDPFLPANPAQLENETKKVAEENGFVLNRGNSIGARLMARRRLG
jgi:hypothetical protein